MNAALLCPGPSLERFKAAPRYDLTIAVNRAVLAYPCDFWAVQDWPLFLETVPPADCDVFTTVQCRDDIIRHDGIDRLSNRLVLFTDDVYFYDAEPAHWDLYTATAALLLAWDQGATSVTCYGCDRTGTADWDGTKRDSDNRTDARWAYESALWSSVVDWLRRHGLKVTE